MAFHRWARLRREKTVVEDIVTTMGKARQISVIAISTKNLFL